MLLKLQGTTNQNFILLNKNKQHDNQNNKKDDNDLKDIKKDDNDLKDYKKRW